MADYTIRPSSVVTNGGGTNPSAAATVRANLSDNSDATFVDRNVTGARTWTFGLPNPSIAADEFCWQTWTATRVGTTGKSNTIGSQVRRSSDPIGVVPVGQNVLGSAQNITYQNYVAYTAAELAALVLDWYSSQIDTSYMRTFDVSTIIRTIKRSTATPQATTMSSSAVPVVPVQIANVVETIELVPTGTRKVRIEARVEQGGTTVGTGTLIEELTFEYDLSASGTFTDTVNANFTKSLANGTYRVYARATRFRFDYPTVRTDQVSAWSTAAILTMNVPLPPTPTIAVVKDDNLATFTATITPGSAAGYSSPAVSLERSDDNGTTWAPVRNGTLVAATFGVGTVIVDREAPRGVAVLYRANQRATYTGGSLNTSAWSSTAGGTLALPATWNLRAPQLPAVDILGIRVIGQPSEQIDEDLGVFRAIDRRYPIIVTGELTGWDGSITVNTSTAAEWDALQAIIEAQLVLLLQAPYGWQKYVRLVGGAKANTGGTPSAPQRTATLNYVETGAP